MVADLAEQVTHGVTTVLAPPCHKGCLLRCFLKHTWASAKGQDREGLLRQKKSVVDTLTCFTNAEACRYCTGGTGATGGSGNTGATDNSGSTGEIRAPSPIVPGLLDEHSHRLCYPHIVLQP